MCVCMCVCLRVCLCNTDWPNARHGKEGPGVLVSETTASAPNASGLHVAFGWEGSIECYAPRPGNLGLLVRRPRP